jgi:GntR family transcriptional regulator/MocR family aminotransferase
VIPRALVDRFAAVRMASDLCPPYLCQAALADFLGQGHFARHVRKTKALYAERRSALVESLRDEFGPGLEILGAEAGMHLVMTIPPECSDKEISKRAAQDDLWIWPLSTAYQGRKVRQGFILGFGCTKAADMPLMVSRMRRAMFG